MSLVGVTVGGRYAVLEEVGLSAVGVVYIAEHIKLHRHVVIKTLSGELAADAKVKERFQNEALIQANLTHTNIVRATDFIYEAERGVLGIVMDHVAGPSLEAHLYDEMGGAMSLPRIGAVMLPVLDAMAFAHDNAVVHRDLKPASILLDRSDGVEVPKVTDFGIAKLLGEGASKLRTRAGAVIGTPSYMPPEQLKGAADIDHRVDVYALGAILYQLASGALPFGAGTEYEITYRILQGESPPSLSQVRPELGEAFSDVVARAMAFEREARFQSVKAFREALSEAVAGGAEGDRAQLQRLVKLRAEGFISELEFSKMKAELLTLGEAEEGVEPSASAAEAQGKAVKPLLLVALVSSLPLLLASLLMLSCCLPCLVAPHLSDDSSGQSSSTSSSSLLESCDELAELTARQCCVSCNGRWAGSRGCDFGGQRDANCLISCIRSEGTPAECQ